MAAGYPDPKLKDTMRRTLEVSIIQEPDAKENRDAGKTFLVTEVSAVQAEEWGLRAIMALGTSGIVVPQETADAGLIGAVLVGYQAFMGAKPSEVLPLWREMIPACVKYQPSPGIAMPYDPSLIEEPGTLLLLRQKILEIHTGFTLAELAQKLQENTIARQALNSQTTSTSASSSEQS
jgi:hypothetical protein